MIIQNWNFTLLDTGFFRTGQPFHAGEGGYSRITSHFPPPMSTLQGAIRSALAAARGWRPGKNDSWPKELGDTDSLGQLAFRGPHLLKLEKDNKGGYLFPAPLHLLVKENPGVDSEISTDFLMPGEALVCDLGTAVCLPRIRRETKLDGARLPEKFYLTREGYAAVAEEKNPSNLEIFKKEDLWQEEVRIGLKCNTETRTAEDHNLYRIGHIRPEYHLKISVIVNGLPSEWPSLQQKIVPLGGEGRLAAVEINPIAPDEYRNLLPPCPRLTPAKDGQIRFTLSLITPCSSNNMELLIRKGPANAPGRCVSACIGKPQLYGGWDLKNEEPRPLQPYLPPGSTWFFEAAAEEKEKIEALHGQCISDEAALSYGYGQVLIGKWEVD
jgi:CRISPR-associated protein Cmr3